MKHVLRCSHMDGGYVALTSALIVVVLILAIVVAVSLITYLGGSNINTSYYKDISLGLARSCANSALLKLVQSSMYSGNETLTVWNSTCQIAPVVASGNQKIVTTSANFQSIATNLKITLNSSDLSIVSWEEQ